MIKHYKFVFNGSIVGVFQFDVHESDEYDWDNPFQSNMDKHIYKKDGYLYINGQKITNNPKGIDVILDNLNDGNIGIDTGESFVDCTFVIDETGYVICKKHNHSSNKIDRFLSKLLG